MPDTRKPTTTGAVFLDRDGVILDTMGYPSRPEEVVLLPGISEAIRALNAANLAVVVVTNQSGIARGYLTEATLRELHAVMTERLSRAGARVDAVYYCPHHPDIGEPPYRKNCECRKPRSGMILQAALDLNIDLAKSCLIGDTLSDIEAAERAGIGWRFLVRTGHGKSEEDRLAAAPDSRLPSPDAIFDNAAAAVEALLTTNR